MSSKRKVGRLYGVGVGPGDPELLTLKASKVLSQVSVVFVPKWGKESYARKVVEGSKGPGQVIELEFPMVRDGEKLERAHLKAVEKMAERLFEGDDCAFATEGDPLLYSTFVPILMKFRELYPEVDIEVIPGVSSISASTARALIPLASGREKVAIIPAPYVLDRLPEVLKGFETVVLLKIYKVFPQLLRLLEENGLLGSCVYIQRATTDEEMVVRDLRELEGKALDYLSLLMVRREDEG